MDRFWRGLGVGLVVLFMNGPVQADSTVITPGAGAGLFRLGGRELTVAHTFGPATLNYYGDVHLYRLSDGTRVVYRTARERIVSINFSGARGSHYRLDRDLRFGVSRKAVTARYGVPDTVIGDNLIYDRLGIGFYFRKNRLSEVWVYPRATVTSTIARR